MKPRVFLCCIFMCLFFSRSFGQVVQVFETLENLKTDPINNVNGNVTMAELKGYYVPGDGGGGKFEWVGGSGIPSYVPSTLPSDLPTTYSNLYGVVNPIDGIGPADGSGSLYVNHHSDGNAANSAIDGYWKRIIDNNTVNVLWMGVRSTAIDDVTPTIRTQNNNGVKNAIAASVFLHYLKEYKTRILPVEWEDFKDYNVGGKVYIPGAENPYFFENSIYIDKNIELIGAGSVSTILVMNLVADAAQFDGVGILDESNPSTDGRAGIFVTKPAFESDIIIKIENLQLRYRPDNAFNPPNNPVDGVYSNQPISLKNVIVFGFPGNGFHIWGRPAPDPQTDPPTSGYISDFCKLTDCIAQGNSLNGFYIEGYDAQEGIFSGCDARNNFVWGYYDQSAFGNTYLNCTSNYNGHATSLNDPSSNGGGFKIEGQSNRSRLFGCYSEIMHDKKNEGGQYTMVFGGSVGQVDNWAPGSKPNIITNGTNRVQLYPDMEIPSSGFLGNYDVENKRIDIIGIGQKQSTPQGLNGGGGIGLHTYDEIGGDGSYLLTQNVGSYEKDEKQNRFLMFQRNNLWANTSYMIAKPTTSKDHFGYSGLTTPNGNIGGRIAFPFGIYLRSFDNSIYTGLVGTSPNQSSTFIEQYRTLSMANYAPLDFSGNNESLYHGKNYAVGDIVLNTNVGTGGNPNVLGWRCTQAGYPYDPEASKRGTWQVMTLANLGAANNGLTLNTGTNTVELGGTLTKQTNIDLNTQQLNLNVGTDIPYAGGGTSLNPRIGFRHTTAAGGIIYLNNTPFIHTKGVNNSTYIGAHAGYQNGTTSGSGACTGIGSYALYAAGTGYNNTAVGTESLMSTTTGGNNTAVGRSSLKNGSGVFNVAIGAYAFINNAGTSAANGYPLTGSNNVYIGANAYPTSGSSLTTASNKLYINSYLDWGEGTGSNNPLIGGDFYSRNVTVNRDITLPFYSTLDINGTGRFSGAVIIGTTDANYPLTRFNSAQTEGYNLMVKGKILTEECVIRVFPPTASTYSNPTAEPPYLTWPDYVFDKNYKLRPLNEVEAFVTTNKHLPGISSSEEIKEKEGIEMGKMQITLLEKVEELTLYAIKADKENKEAKEKIKSLEERLRKLEQAINLNKQ